MPTYDYKCPKCNDTVELIHAINLPRVIVCPDCNVQMNKIISGGTGIHLKGSGFYETDYKGK